MISPEQIAFIDIETASQVAHFNQLAPRMKAIWQKKAAKLNNETNLNEEQLYVERAGIFAEFGKIIAIGIGFFVKDENQNRKFRVKVLAADNEKEILTAFCQIIEPFAAKNYWLCGHNAKEFDFPYLCRRLLINQMSIPTLLQVQGRKPWETPYLDTLEMWKFGDFKHFTSLETLAAVLNVPDDSELDGSMVNNVYHQEKNLAKIAAYCASDVVLTAQVFLKLNALPIIEKENIVTLLP
jgi:DNA polymerase elongation subunit (family B)